MPARIEAAPTRRRPVLLVLALMLLALTAAGLGYLAWLVSPTGAHAATLEVLPATTLDVVAGSLKRRGLIRNARSFILLYQVQGHTPPREGLYRVDGRMTLPQIVTALASEAGPRTVRVTVPEGLRAVQVVERFAAAGPWPRAALRAAFTNAALSRFTRGHPSLEGFLFPATFDARLLAAPSELAQMMLDRFALEVTPEREARLRALNLDVYGWVTLASMVQSEAGNEAQMPLIAGVFLNRLDVNMPLQSDPTTAYGLGIPMNRLDSSRGDFTKDTPYNTYTRRGLPLGPVGNPGEAALTSILNARRNASDGRPNLYFLHGLHGEFRANPDYAGHLRDLNQVR